MKFVMFTYTYLISRISLNCKTQNGTTALKLQFGLCFQNIHLPIN